MAGPARQGCPGDRDGGKDGDSPFAAFGRAKSRVPSPGWMHGKGRAGFAAWNCCRFSLKCSGNRISFFQTLVYLI